MLYTNLLYHSRLDTQISPSLCLFQDLALNIMSFHFGDMCVTTQLLQQRLTASLSEFMLYTHLSYHSSMFDFQSFHLYNCMFIYLPVVLRSCFTTTILKVRSAPLPDAVAKTPRLQKMTKVAQHHVYLNHCKYVNIHIRVCHFDFMLYTDLSYRVHAFHLFIV